MGPRGTPWWPLRASCTSTMGRGMAIPGLQQAALGLPFGLPTALPGVETLHMQLPHKGSYQCKLRRSAAPQRTGALGSPRAPQGPPEPPGCVFSNPSRYGFRTFFETLPKIRFFVSNNNDFDYLLVQNIAQTKLRLRGLDLSGEIRAEFLRTLAPRMCKMVGWRPSW